MKSRPYSVIVFASDANAAALAAVMPRPCVRVTSPDALLREVGRRLFPVLFVDHGLVSQIAGELHMPVVALFDDPATMLTSSIATLGAHTWIQHTLISSFLTTSGSRAYLEQLLDQLFDRQEPQPMADSARGRVALLSNAGRREQRFQRMRAFFETNGLSKRAIEAAIDVTEELVMNALYDAPYEAGYLATAVPRTELVELPPERACEISYGVRGSELFIRLRDTFGALTRRRILDVLTRCASSAVALDESRGGAGLGLWRIFSTVSSITITVTPKQVTDIVVTIATKRDRATKLLRAINLFFAAPIRPSADRRGELDDSFTLVYALDSV